MNVLAEKNLLDEDDEDYVKLIQYSQGNIPSGKMKECHEGYAKGCDINTALQYTFSCIETLSSNERSESDLANIFNVKSEATAASESNNVDHNVSVAKGNQETSRVGADNIKSAQKESSTSEPTKVNNTNQNELNSSRPEHKGRSNVEQNVNNVNLDVTTQLDQSRISPFSLLSL